MDDTYYMKLALAEARQAADRGEIPVGAVVVCKDCIIARAYNLTEALTDVTAHAEMQAITAAASTLGGKYLNECTLYVTVEPCVMCAGAIGWAQLKRLVFGAEDVKRGYRRYAPQDGSGARLAGRRVCCADESFLCGTPVNGCGATSASCV